MAKITIADTPLRMSKNSLKNKTYRFMRSVSFDSFSSELAQGRTGRQVIEDLVQITGGRAFFPDSVDELEDICTKIGLELRNQYVLGYRSTNRARDGKWRKIHLRVNPPKGLGTTLTVRAKSGYYAPTAESRP